MKLVISQRSRLLLWSREHDLNLSLPPVLLRWHVPSTQCLNIWRMEVATEFWKTFPSASLLPSKESSSLQREYPGFHSCLWMIRSLCSRLVSRKEIFYDLTRHLLFLTMKSLISRLSCVRDSVEVDNTYSCSLCSFIDSTVKSGSAVCLFSWHFHERGLQWYTNSCLTTLFPCLLYLFSMFSFSWSLCSLVNFLIPRTTGCYEKYVELDDDATMMGHSCCFVRYPWYWILWKKQAGVFEVLLVRLACMFDSQTNSMICLNGLVLRRDSLHSASNARFLMDSMFDFAERMNALQLTDHEIGLFSAVVVIAPGKSTR